MSNPIALYALDPQLDLKECCQNACYWGANTLIVSPELYDEPELNKQLNKFGLNLWLNISVFNQKSYLKKHPDKIAITQKGNLANNDWCQFVCPSDQIFLSELKQQITNYLSALSPQYISLDFLRQYLNWQTLTYNELNFNQIEYGCFCSRCINAFYHSDLASADATDEIESQVFSADFARWRGQIIEQICADLSQLIRQMCPSAQLVLNTLPWPAGDIQNAQQLLGGQNLKNIGRYFDAISPVAFSHLLPQPPEHVAKLMAGLNRENQTPVYYGLQISHWRYKKAISAAQFERELKYYLSSSHKGLVVYDYAELKKDGQKAAIFKRHLNPEINF
ncbi:hypothetical protein [Gayadomonas joobiniege]|uniref:hypothetical protein n=1 Tax=Gayadomonas joobiniege TaxID=1234606 RepID=UPI0003789A82|nr:hypothetical protein [Gayadomonas joobiniege]